MKCNWYEIKVLFESTLRIIIAIFLIILGIMGLFLPFLQGIALIVFGCIMLGGKPVMDKISYWKHKIQNYVK